MADSKTGAVTQADFVLFKQEMKSEFTLFKQEMKSEYRSFQEEIKTKFELYLSQIDSKTETMINKRVDKIGKWVIGLGTLFVIAFFTYFEVMRTKVEQVNSDRMARLEDVILASMSHKMTSGQEQRKDNKNPILSTSKKIKARK